MTNENKLDPNKLDPFEVIRNPRWATINEYAHAHDLIYFTVYMYVQQGKLPAVVREVDGHREYRVDITHKVPRGRGGRPRGSKNKKNKEVK